MKPSVECHDDEHSHGPWQCRECVGLPPEDGDTPSEDQAYANLRIGP